MNIKILINKQINEWLCYNIFPVMLEQAAAKLKLSDNNKNQEYWNTFIVTHVFKLATEKFEKKLGSNKANIYVKLNVPEAYTLHQVLQKIPIEPNHHWKIQQRQFLIDQLDKELMLSTIYNITKTST